MNAGHARIRKQIADAAARLRSALDEPLDSSLRALIGGRAPTKQFQFNAPAFITGASKTSSAKARR